MTDNLSQLLATELQPLRDEWRSADAGRDAARGPRAARAEPGHVLDVGGRTAALDAAVEHRPDRRARRLHLLRRRPDERRRQLRGPLGGEPGHGGPDGGHLGGRARGRPHRHLRRARRRGEPAGRRRSRRSASGAGDVVAIYMPNAVEAFTAVHACNRIGAIYTILFSGFGPDAVRSRLEASRAKVVIVLDASYRRGKLTPLLDTLRQARGKVDTVEHTIVVDRTGRGVPLEIGEISYPDALQLAPDGIAGRRPRGQRPGVPDLHQRHRGAAEGRRAQRGRVPARHVGQRALAGRPRARRRLLGGRRRRLADLPDPGGGRRSRATA